MSPDEHYLNQDLSNFGVISSFSVIMIVLTGFLVPKELWKKKMPSLPEKKYTDTVTMNK